MDEFSTIRSGQSPISIQFLPQDSSYARQALPILEQTLEEIILDLSAERNEMMTVIIAPTRKFFLSFIQGDLPRWADAFAVSSHRLMVVKSPRFDRTDKNFRQTLIHELSHLLLYERVGKKNVPRWLDEGLAIFYSAQDKWRLPTALSKAASTRSLIPLSEIDRVLDYHRIKAELAYQESYSAVYYLLATYGVKALSIILDGIKYNDDMDQIFLRATGSSFYDYEQEWIAYVRKTQKWYWLSDIDSYIWIIIFVLMVSAVVLVRLRNRKKIRSWEEESLDESSAEDESDYEVPFE